MWSSRVKMLIVFLLLGTATTAPTDELQSIVDTELPLDDPTLQQIIPSGFPWQKSEYDNNINVPDLIDKEDEDFLLFNSTIHNLLQNESAKKGLVFNIYDSSMRQSAMSLYLLLQNLSNENFHKVKKWVQDKINSDMYDYVIRKISLNNKNINQKDILPPFITKPNYFVNGETIVKALQLRSSGGNINAQEAKINGIQKINKDLIAINTNYSGWNIPSSSNLLNYFREDIGLNSYYYGLHLMYPFWELNEDLMAVSENYPRHYYFSHKQLLARYLLEKEHIENIINEDYNWRSAYNPYLLYSNGLQFPMRPSFDNEDSKRGVQLKVADIAINEVISRGYIAMDGRIIHNMTDDNYVDIIVKIIKANFESSGDANGIRSLFGYNSDDFYLSSRYNPAPSILHHPQTTLRDPLYWYLIFKILNYFTEFTKTMQPLDLSVVETDEFDIMTVDFSKITTYFDNYQFSLNKAWFDDYHNGLKKPLTITARQNRLRHTPFKFDITLNSKHNIDATIRLFIGPECFDQCWKLYSKFFQLDCYKISLLEGNNVITWSPDKSNKYSRDDLFDLEKSVKEENKFNMFKFPESLIIPRGVKEGLNMTLFVIVTPADKFSLTTDNSNSLYEEILNEVDNYPLGFPFHREATGSYTASNYRFFNISIFHDDDIM